LILRVKHVLQLGKYFNAFFQQLFRPRFIFGGSFTGIIGIDILEPKVLAADYAVRYDEFLGPFDDFFFFHFVGRELVSSLHQKFEKIAITAKANAVFMVVLLIDTKDNYPQLIRVALGSIFQMLSLLLSLVRSYGTKVLHLFTGPEL
jgi:hypothetical protein